MHGVDTCCYTSLEQRTDIWHIRESLAVALKHDGYTYKYDVSLPLSHFYALVALICVHLEPTLLLI